MENESSQDGRMGQWRTRRLYKPSLKEETKKTEMGDVSGSRLKMTEKGKTCAVVWMWAGGPPRLCVLKWNPHRRYSEAET